MGESVLYSSPPPPLHWQKDNYIAGFSVEKEYYGGSTTPYSDKKMVYVGICAYLFIYYLFIYDIEIRIDS